MKKYWKIEVSVNGLLSCTCPKCGAEKERMHIGRFEAAKCLFCGIVSPYNKADIKRFGKGYRNVEM